LLGGVEVGSFSRESTDDVDREWLVRRRVEGPMVGLWLERLGWDGWSSQARGSGPDSVGDRTRNLWLEAAGIDSEAERTRNR
jgi:hypothetical protein